MSNTAGGSHDTLVHEWLDEQPSQAPRPATRRTPPVPRHGATRRMTVAVLAVLLAVAGISALSLAGSHQRHARDRASILALSPAGRARADAVEFLRRYEAPDGRVVRTDQGGDTVSEGQGYAMLLATVVGNGAQFEAAWSWDQQHLQLPDGLFAYHWSGGKVVSNQPATDADLDTAWALVLASTRFEDPTYLADGLQVASAIMADETEVVDGRLELVAGPWGRADPAVVNPSYLAPEAMAALAVATGDPAWSELETDSTQLDAALTGARTAQLLPDWADVVPNGTPIPVGEPSGSGIPAYGLDAQRAPVWLAAGCEPGDRAVAARDWPLLEHADAKGARVSYSLAGTSTATTVNPVGLVAAAAAAAAAGHSRASTTLLNQADQQSAKYHTYYGDAWIALGRIMLDTNWLSSCAPGVHATS
jgi:endoglucanase